MTLNQSATKLSDKLADAAESPYIRLLGMLFVPLVVIAIGWVGATLVSQGQALAGINVSLQNLKEGQVRIENLIGVNSGRIAEVFNVTNEHSQDLARLKQAIDDRRREH